MDGLHTGCLCDRNVYWWPFLRTTFRYVWKKKNTLLHQYHQSCELYYYANKHMESDDSSFYNHSRGNRRRNYLTRAFLKHIRRTHSWIPLISLSSNHRRTMRSWIWGNSGLYFRYFFTRTKDEKYGNDGSSLRTCVSHRPSSWWTPLADYKHSYDCDSLYYRYSHQRTLDIFCTQRT